ncbi:hypothetical protein EJ110_NYTH20325 [Nymphaea thermarum]|nr:hypothetical protein EJ110_NYTH20325 [Nymphaea thermarum]
MEERSISITFYQKVTKACKGFLRTDGDWPSSAKAEGSLTARPNQGQKSALVIRWCRVEGFPQADGNWPSSAREKGSSTHLAETKVGLGDPMVPRGRVVAQWIKVTLGIPG